MNKEQLVFANFTMDRLDQAIRMATDSFQTNNVFSKEGLQTREELQFRTSVSLQLFKSSMDKFNEQNKTQCEFIKILLYRGQMVAMIMACELHRFIDDLLGLVDPQDPYAQAFKIFTKEQYPKNQTLLGSLLVVHKDYMRYNLTSIIVIKAAMEWIGKGFKVMVGGSTNPISLKLSKKYGGKMIQQIKLKRNGKEAPIYLIRADVEDLYKLLPHLKPKL